MINVRGYVESLDLADGQRHRGKCPSCHRGNTFTATNDMGKLLWNCYANSCNLSGATRINMTIEEIRKRMDSNFKIDTDKAFAGLNVAKPTQFVLPESVVKGTKQDILDEYCNRYGIDSHELSLHYDVKEDRIVFPMFLEGKMVDAIGRAVDSKVIPKWKRYGSEADGFIRGNCTIAVIVEDCTSASVVETLELTGVAILGTTINQNHIQGLKDYKKVIVALDPDAAPKTIEYTRKLKANGIDAFALKLLDDIKYRRAEDIAYLHKLKREFHGTTDIKEPTQ
tara:strand:- start:242 stop:1087 length:846 start_codon:yes stop_codon:yes gene_type:complete